MPSPGAPRLEGLGHLADEDRYIERGLGDPGFLPLRPAHSAMLSLSLANPPLRLSPPPWGSPDP